jgi:hypothetical protein
LGEGLVEKRMEEPVAKRGSGRRPSTVRGCRAYLQRELMRQYPEIVQGFLKEAKKGSCQHLKLVQEMMEAEKASKRPKVVEQLLRRMAG